MSNNSYFNAGKQSPWYVVAFGMVGVSISAVTFISVPGLVEENQFSYFQMVLGNSLGFLFIAFVLLPMYYKHNLITIYSYLGRTLGKTSQKTASAFFIVSRFLGAGLRLFLTCKVLQIIFFDALNIPFFVNVIAVVTIIYLYTKKGGMKTVVWTDFLQTFVLVVCLIITLYTLFHSLGEPFLDILKSEKYQEYSQAFFFEEYLSSKSFIKNFLAGFFIAIAMTGLDQDLMQKNLTCKNITEAKRNMVWFSVLFPIVVYLFLMLGAMLSLHAKQFGIVAEKDELFTQIALQSNLGSVVASLFVIGVIATSFSSIDSTITSLTTSIYYDIKNVKTENILLRKRIHAVVTIAFIFLLILFGEIENDSIVTVIFKAAGYTYGPLLGLFAYAMLVKKTISDKYTFIPCFLAPLLTFFVSKNISHWIPNYTMGFELIIVCSLFTFLGIFFLQKKNGTLPKSI